MLSFGLCIQLSWACSALPTERLVNVTTKSLTNVRESTSPQIANRREKPERVSNDTYELATARPTMATAAGMNKTVRPCTFWPKGYRPAARTNFITEQ